MANYSQTLLERLLYDDYYVTNGLILYWRLDEGSGSLVRDALGSHDATQHNGIWTTGKLGGAVDYSSGGYLWTPHSPALSGSTFSVAFWFYPNPSVWNTYNYIATKNTDVQGGLKRGWRILYRATELGNVYATLYNTSSAPNDSAGIYLTAGEWVHIALTFDGTSIILYKNGVSAGTRTMSGTYAPDTDYPLLFSGGSGNNIAPAFVGMVDEFRYYNRALSSAEVIRLSNVRPVFSSSRPASESCAPVDSYLRSITKVRTNSLLLTDTLSKSESRSLSESVALVRSITKSESRSLLESMALVDSRLRSLTRLLPESLSLGDFYSRTWSASRLLTPEVCSLADSLSKSISTARKDTLLGADSLSRLVSWNRTLSEPLHLTDAFSKLKILILTLNEAMALTEFYAHTPIPSEFYINLKLLSPYLNLVRSR